MLPMEWLIGADRQPLWAAWPSYHWENLVLINSWSYFSSSCCATLHCREVLPLIKSGEKSLWGQWLLGSVAEAGVPESVLSQRSVELVAALRIYFKFSHARKEVTFPFIALLILPLPYLWSYWRPTLALKHWAFNFLVGNLETIIFLILVVRTKRFCPLSRKISLFLRHLTGVQMTSVQLLTSLWISYVPLHHDWINLLKLKLITFCQGRMGPSLCVPFQGFRAVCLWNSLLVRHNSQLQKISIILLSGTVVKIWSNWKLDWEGK